VDDVVRTTTVRDELLTLLHVLVSTRRVYCKKQRTRGFFSVQFYTKRAVLNKFVQLKYTS